MKMRLIKPLPGPAISVKVGDVFTATPCRYVPKCFNLRVPGNEAQLCTVPEEFLEEVKS